MPEKKIIKKYLLFLLKKIVNTLDTYKCLLDYYLNFKKFKLFILKSGKDINHISKKNIAIYHIYTKSIDKDNKQFLDFISKKGFHIIISSALVLDQKSLKYLNNSEINYSLFYKNNVGRDIHSYKYFYESLIKINLNFDNILFCNDSLFFIEDLSESLSQKLDNFFNKEEKTVASLTINYRSHAHLGSFFLLIKNNQLILERLSKFFSNYLPISNREWSIKYGECGISDCLRYPNDFHISVFYPTTSLIKIKDIKKILLSAHLISIIKKEKLNPLIKKFLSDIYNFNLGNNCKEFSLEEENIIKSIYVDNLSQIIPEKYNPTHALALNLCLAGFPFLKKDLNKVYAKFSFTHIYSTLKACDLKEENIDYIIEGLSSKNYIESYSHMDILYRIKNELLPLF